MRKAALILGMLGLAGGVLAADRTVVITLDDLPFTGEPADPRQVEKFAGQIVDTLSKHDVPATGFVTGKNVVVDGQADMRIGLLRRWQEAGLSLDNHGFSHLSFQKTGLREYLDDVLLGHLFPTRVLGDQAEPPRFFRAPYNHTGPSPEAKQALLDFLDERGVRLAPFTIEHSDYVYNKVYVAASARGDRQEMKKLGAAYLDGLDRAFAFGESLSMDTFGREIPQIFLIHTNLINARYLDDMLTALKERGYRFISLDQAMRDAAYSTDEPYVGPHGISWFHRWRRGLDKKNRLRDEPDPESWVYDAYRRLVEASRPRASR